MAFGLGSGDMQAAAAMRLGNSSFRTFAEKSNYSQSLSSLQSFVIRDCDCVVCVVRSGIRRCSVLWGLAAACAYDWGIASTWGRNERLGCGLSHGPESISKVTSSIASSELYAE